MMKNTPSVMAITLTLLVSGCTTQPPTKLSDLPTTKLLRPKTRNGDAEKIGLALSGGGTKAASYAIGVLAAVAQSDEELGKINAISSVSGGSYASLFLFSKLMLRDQDGQKTRHDVKDYFADCMPDHYKNVLPQGYLSDEQPLCNGTNEDRYIFQKYVRCHQDVLQSDCKPELNGDADKNEVVSALKLIGETAGIFVPNFIARTVFDWPVNLSPTRHAYQQGIWSTYGLYPVNIDVASKRSNIDKICDEKHFLNCAEKSANGKANSNKLSFEQLKNTLDHHPNYPTWIINATASKKRSFLGWAMSGQRDFSQYTLQMSPYGGARAGLYGDFNTKESKFDLDLLEAVTVSAAFADANQTAVGQPGRFLIAAAAHLGGFDWGEDIANPNVDGAWRYLHNVLPFPLYYTDGTLRFLGGATEDKTRSAYVHSMDGGNNDDLGVFTLLEAEMKQIFIADSANDSKGKLEDLCLLHNELRIRNRHKLIIPGLEGLENHCLNLADESEKAKGIVPGVIGSPTQGHYSILNWKHKVLVGCIRSDDGNSCDSSQASGIVAKIFLLKPAINLDEMKEKYIDISAKRVSTEACDKAKNPGLCEVAAFLVDSYDPHNEDDHGLGAFPQDSTVWMTANSDAKRYGAYRELGRWQMTKALELSKDQAEFDKVLADQTQHKISYDSDTN